MGTADLTVAGGQSSPAVADFNGDRRLDLLVGNTDGQLYFYPNTDTLTAPAFERASQLTAGGIAIDLPDAASSRPFLGDYDGDGISDVLLGAADGLVRLYRRLPGSPPGPDLRFNDGHPGGWYVHQFPVSAESLTVSQFTWTVSGFVAAFNRALELSVLNLYDGAGGALGPADVVLRNSSGTVVAGSIVVDASRQQLTFVATGGPLTPDVYTVTLKSGAAALRDAGGSVLDGDADWTPGGDFTAQFTVPTPPADTRLVSLPDLARGASQSVNVPNTAAGLPIRLDNAAGVTSLAVDLVYEPALLNVTAAALAAGIPADWTVALDTGTAGLARITATGTTPLSGTNVDIVRLTAAVPSTAPYGAVQAIRLENVSLSAGAIAAVGDVAVHKAAYLGDADGSGIHSSADAFLTVQAALGLASGFAAHSWTDPRIVGDADGSGVLSAADAFLIVQEGLGLAEPFVPDNPHITVTPVGGGVDPQFRIDADLLAPAGGWVSVPVKLGIEAAATNVGAIDFALFFDSSRLTIQVPDGVAAGADTAGWAVSAMLVAPGQLRVGMVSVSGRPLAAGQREIARLQFHVEAGESSRTGWQPVADGLPIRPTLLPPLTDHRSPITDASDGSETHPTRLDIEPVDARAGGYAWTDADGSVLIRSTDRAAAARTRERIWREMDPKAELLDSVLADLVHEIASAWR